MSQRPISLPIEKVPSVENGTGTIMGISAGATLAAQPVVDVLPLPREIIKDSDFWLNNPSVLVDSSKIFNIFPSKTLPPRERLNAMVRLGAIVTGGLILWKGTEYIVIFIVIAIYTLYLDKKNARKELFETENFTAVRGCDRAVSRNPTASTNNVMARGIEEAGPEGFKDLKPVPFDQYDGLSFRESMYSRPSTQKLGNQVRRVDVPKPKTLFDELSEKPDMVTQSFNQDGVCTKELGRGASQIIDGIDVTSILRSITNKPVPRNQIYNKFNRNRIGGTNRACQYFLANKNRNETPISEMDAIQSLVQHRNNTLVNAFKQNVADKEAVFGTSVRFLGDIPASTSGRGSYISGPLTRQSGRGGKLLSPNDILTNPNRTYY